MAQITLRPTNSDIWWSLPSEGDAHGYAEVTRFLTATDKIDEPMSYPTQLRLSAFAWLGYAVTSLTVVGILSAVRPALHTDHSTTASLIGAILASALLGAVLSRLRWPLERSKLDAAQPMPNQQLLNHARSWARIVLLAIVGVAVVCFLGVSAIRKDYATPRLIADLFILFGIVWFDTARRVQAVENIRHANFFEVREPGSSSVLARRLVRIPNKAR